MNVPATLLSMIYQATRASFQDELHTDIDQTFRKYAITELTRRQFSESGISPSKITPAAELLSLGKKIEEGAAAQRRKPEGTPASPSLVEPTNEFFRKSASWLAAELTLGLPQPDQNGCAGNGASVPAALYRLLYCSNPKLKAKPGAVSESDWTDVSNAVEARQGDFEALLPVCERLCLAMAAEFNGSLWPHVW